MGGSIANTVLEREVMTVFGQKDHALSVVIMLGDHLAYQPLLKKKKHGCSAFWLSLDGKQLAG